MSKLRKTIGFIISLTVLAICVYIFLIAVFPPGVFLSPYYILFVFITAGLLLFLFYFVVPKLYKKLNIGRYFEFIRQWSYRKKLTWFAFSMIFLILLVLIKPVSDNINDSKVLESAREQFSVVIYSSISEAKINRTLVELQKALDKLRAEYIAEPPDYVIKVHLFANRNELIERTGLSEWSAGGALLLPGRVPELAITAEKESSIWNSSRPTTTPAHEITHVVTFEALNQKDMKLVPIFVLEGMAEYETMRGIYHFPDRMINRMRLIFYKNDLSRLEIIPSLGIKDESVNQEDLLLFYLLSEEFIRYLIHIYGEHTPWYVVQDVGQGTNFYEAFQKVYNTEYTTAYSEFLSYFY